MLQHLFNKEPPMTDFEERDRRPRLPDSPVPPRQPEYRAPPIRRDPEVEAMMVSANTLLQLRDQVAELTAQRNEIAHDLEVWRARAEAKEELLSITHTEMLRYKSFCDSFTGRFTDISVLLVKLMEDADKATRDFASADSVRAGSRPEPAIDESHLQPQQETPDAGK